MTEVSLRSYFICFFTAFAVPALAALVLFVVWATDQAGYPVTHWAPGVALVIEADEVGGVWHAALSAGG
jgi:hypothetical protein